MAMSSEQEVRAAAIKAAVLHHKVFAWNHNDTTRFQPKIVDPGLIVTTARVFEDYIQGEG